MKFFLILYKLYFCFYFSQFSHRPEIDILFPHTYKQTYIHTLTTIMTYYYYYYYRIFNTNTNTTTAILHKSIQKKENDYYYYYDY